MLLLRTFLRLTRFDTSGLAFLAIFIPFWVRTGNVSQSFERAIPLLFIYICAFIANDLDDVEKDLINHPDRPLPTGNITQAVAAVLYFTFLGFALLSTWHYVTQGVAFFYYALLALHISYGYLVESLPGWKAPYVGAMNTLPILIVATQYAEESKLFVAAGAIFFLVLGREILMDIKDRPGDASSYVHRFDSANLAILGFSLQVIGLICLGSQMRRRGDAIALLGMILLLSLSVLYWFKFSKYRVAIIVMKFQWFAGLYFLT